MSWDITTASEEWLIDLCHRTNEEGGHIGGPMGGDQVVKLSDHIAAKFGLGVCASEAAMQEFAYNTVDRNIVRIPKVYRYLESKKRDPHGYLFMEYIPGQNLQDIDLEARKDILPRIASIITHLGQIKSAIPGPVTGGEPLGYIWGDYGARTAFKSIEDMNVYMNSRLQHLNANIDLTPHLLVLCHGDICRRNIILADDGSICFLDWAYSGFYPRFFELATITCAWYDSFQEPLVREVESAMNLTDEERRDMQLLLRVRHANLRWTFMEKQEQTSEEEEEYEATLFESVYGKDWKAIIAKIRGLSGLTTDTSNTVVPQPEGNEETEQPDAGKRQDLLGISHIGAPQTEGNENTVQSDERKSENIIDSCDIGVHQPDGNQNIVQSDAGKGEDRIDTSDIGVPQIEGNENTVPSDARKSENIIDSCDIGVPQPEGNQNSVQSDAGKGEDIIDASHIGIHERESNMHTEQSDAGKDEDLSEHDVKQIA